MRKLHCTCTHTHTHTHTHTCIVTLQHIWLMVVSGFTQRVEAEAAYKQAVANANDCQYQVHISQVYIF